MGRKKRRFSDWEAFATYCRVREDYPGMVEALSLRSSQSGMRLILHQEFSCFGLDRMGDLGESRFHAIVDLKAFRHFFVHVLGRKIEELTTDLSLPDEIPSVYDSGRETLYQEGWQRFKRDFDAGLLTLPGLRPLD